MRKTTKWKIIVASLAVLIAGAVYCVFVAKEEDETIWYQDTMQNLAEHTADAADSQSLGSESNPAGESGSSFGCDRSENLAEVSKEKQIYVHVCGAVKTPGVYALPERARVCDAITAAGGQLEGAADDYVNQARYLTDGERLYIPTVEELSGLSVQQYAEGQPYEPERAESADGASAQRAGPVNINTATVSELTTLPGIGESRAQSIIAYREQYGAFSKPEDIMNISGIKSAAYEKIKDRICTGYD